MRFDAFQVCGIMANVSFRPFNATIWRAAITGWVCLAFAGAARAGEGARNIEVVPFHDASINTNLEQPEQNNQSFKSWAPTAPDTMKQAERAPRMANMPRPQSLSKQEQQLQDRRRNWVFATPEDESTDKTERSLLGLDNDNDNLTAMERYYYRLEQSGRSTVTNGASLAPNRYGAQTNSYAGALRPAEPGSFGETPFRDMARDTGVFQQSDAGNVSARAFGNNGVKPVLSPEEVRIQTEQKSHMDSFKQLWNIDQAPAATPIVAPASGPIDSAPLFGASSPGLQAPVRRLPGGPTSASSAPTTLEPDPNTAPRITAAPHTDFSRPPAQPLF